MLDPRAIHIYTDGSCYKNPGGESGCAAIARFPDGRPDEQIVDFGCNESSINRMELMACIEALRWVRTNAPWESVARVLIVTDSQYVTQNIVRAPTWKKNNWRNLAGEPKFNEDLWDKLLKLRTKVAKSGIRVDFVWQKGKTTALGKQVDVAAKTAAKRGGIDIDRDYRPGGVSRSMVKGGSVQRFPAAGQTLVIRPYTKKIMGTDENRISFHIVEEGSFAYSEKFYAFAPPLLSAELHMGNGHRVRFNSDPKYPQFVERIEGVELPKPTPRKGKTVQP